ncbi:MAG TPA: MarR family transcriptional regulator [Blastocatellia bacterium]|nr:MarR family transcriptional regulator [Blastocatellia bacterium]
MFDHCLYFNTTALARLAERLWTEAFRRFDLTPSQAFMLRLILNRPGLLQWEIAEALKISPPTTTRLLNALKTKRLVERHASPTDGRETKIYPTRAAKEIQASLNAASGEVTRTIKQTIGEEVFDEVVSKLRNIRATLG